jgi:hypothetical protein
MYFWSIFHLLGKEFTVFRLFGLEHNLYLLTAIIRDQMEKVRIWPMNAEGVQAAL